MAATSKKTVFKISLAVTPDSAPYLRGVLDDIKAFPGVDKVEETTFYQGRRLDLKVHISFNAPSECHILHRRITTRLSRTEGITMSSLTYDTNALFDK